MRGRAILGLGVASTVLGALGVPVLAVTGVARRPGWVLVGLAAICVVAGLAAAARPTRLEALRLPGVALRAFAVPAVVALAAAVLGILASAVLAGALLGAAVVALLGLLLVRSGAATHHARRLTAEAPALADLPAPSDGLSVRRSRLLNGALGLVWLAFAAAALWEGGDSALLGVPTWAAYAALGAAFLLVALVAGRRYSVAEVGVLVETPLSARLFEWSEFAGYYAGDEDVVLLRRKPWLEDVAFDRDAVSADAFAVLDESLPEREHRTVPAGADRSRASGDAREQ